MSLTVDKMMIKHNALTKRSLGFHIKKRLQKGFTLIEVLVTLFILAIGLLGLAGLLFEGMRNNQGSYLRTQASIMAYDMADRMRANSDQASGYQGFSTNDASTTIPACASDAA
jgi:type IV pilus assembly protein PilV